MVKVKRLRTVIGWREWVSLPGLDTPWIKAKIDTGARTSTLHAFELTVTLRGTREYASFEIHPLQRSTEGAVKAHAEIVEWRKVRSSNGHEERRPVISTELSMGGKTVPIELTLTNRDAMGFRLLLGRRAVRRRFHIDAGNSFFLDLPPGIERKARKKKTKKVKK